MLTLPALLCVHMYMHMAWLLLSCVACGQKCPYTVILTSCDCTGYMSSYGSVDYTSRPSPAASSSGARSTLGQALQQLLPDAFSQEATALQSSSTEGESALASANSAVQQTEQEQTFLKRHDVIVAGVQPALQTPIAWLHSTLHAPDLFLYIIVVVK